MFIEELIMENQKDDSVLILHTPILIAQLLSTLHNFLAHLKNNQPPKWKLKCQSFLLVFIVS